MVLIGWVDPILVLVFSINNVLDVGDDIDQELGVTVLSGTVDLRLVQKDHSLGHHLVVNREVVVLHFVQGVDAAVHVVRGQDGSRRLVYSCAGRSTRSGVLLY